MSKLTTERLEEIAAEYTHAIYPAEVGQMARELLSLRTDAGDEEIEDLLDSMPAPELNEKWVKLTGENECLRNDLRSAREEIENLRLKRAGAVACMDSRLQQIATLTAERDEARRLIRWMVNCLTIFNSGKLSVFLQNIIDDRSYPPSYRREANAILTLAEGGA